MNQLAPPVLTVILLRRSETKRRVPSRFLLPLKLHVVGRVQLPDPRASGNIRDGVPDLPVIITPPARTVHHEEKKVRVGHAGHDKVSHTVVKITACCVAVEEHVLRYCCRVGEIQRRVGFTWDVYVVFFRIRCALRV